MDNINIVQTMQGAHATQHLNPERRVAHEGLAQEFLLSFELRLQVRCARLEARRAQPAPLELQRQRGGVLPGEAELPGLLLRAWVLCRHWRAGHAPVAGVGGSAMASRTHEAPGFGLEERSRGRGVSMNAEPAGLDTGGAGCVHRSSQRVQARQGKRWRAAGCQRRAPVEGIDGEWAFERRFDYAAQNMETVSCCNGINASLKSYSEWIFNIQCLNSRVDGQC
jgi:hypothetical protein